MKDKSTIPKQTWRNLEPVSPLLRPSQVMKETGLSRSTIYELIAIGRFPPFIKIGKRASAMPRSWLDAYLKEMAEDI